MLLVVMVVLVVVVVGDMSAHHWKEVIW